MLLTNFSDAVMRGRQTKPANEKQHQPVRQAKLSYGSRGTGNAIIQADNRELLPSLHSRLGGKVRCIYIDPPYNNQEKYQHYDDNLDHATWVRQIVGCIESLYTLLRDDGSLWISIDDSEVHYLKVAIDQVFGRDNFVSTIIWQQRTTRENRKVFSNNHEYMLVYARNAREFAKARNKIPLTKSIAARYKNVDSDIRGPWQSVSANVQAGHATKSQFYTLVAPNGKKHLPPSGRCWVFTDDKMRREIAAGNVWFGKSGNGAPRLKMFLSSPHRGLTPETLWTADSVGTSDSAKKHLLQMFPKHPVFDTPKPEQLIYRVLQISTDPGDIVLDAYLGSGTTAAVAQKSGRQYLGIEIGEHAVTLCAERLKRVIDGETGGISAEVDWAGGGGFDFYRYRR
jgi:adenine-specific DNA-methyltransferase